MSDRLSKQSPLWYLASRQAPATTPASCIRYWENALQGHMNVRGNVAEAAFSDAVARVLGTALPTAPNTTRSAEHCTVYWLGPDEWLVVTPGEREAALALALRKALEGMHSSVTEVSGGQTILVLQGMAVRDLLAKGSPFDLHAAAFVPGACAQTHLAKAAVLLRPLQDDAMEIIVRRSFADYLWSWIEVAAAEYGLVPATERATKGESPAAREDAVQTA